MASANSHISGPSWGWIRLTALKPSDEAAAPATFLSAASRGP